MILFRGIGVTWFREALAAAAQNGNAARQFYLSAIDSLAKQHPVGIHAVSQEDWAEVDVPADLDRARLCLARWRQTESSLPVSRA